MYAKQVLEWILIATVIVEVIIPGVMGRPLFPILRRKSNAKKLLAEQEQLRMQLELDRIRQENEELKKQHAANVAQPEKENEKNDSQG